MADYWSDKYGPSEYSGSSLDTSQSNVATPKPFVDEHKEEIAYGVVVFLLVAILVVGIVSLVLRSKKAVQS